MQYNIYINQKAFVEHHKELDLKDAVMFDFLYHFYPHGYHKGKWVYISYQHLINNLPLLKINTKSVVGRRMKRLKHSKLINYYYDKDEARIYYCMERIEHLFTKVESAKGNKPPKNSLNTHEKFPFKGDEGIVRGEYDVNHTSNRGELRGEGFSPSRGSNMSDGAITNPSPSKTEENPTKQGRRRDTKSRNSKPKREHWGSEEEGTNRVEQHRTTSNGFELNSTKYNNLDGSVGQKTHRRGLDSGELETQKDKGVDSLVLRGRTFESTNNNTINNTKHGYQSLLRGEKEKNSLTMGSFDDEQQKEDSNTGLPYELYEKMERLLGVEGRDLEQMLMTYEGRWLFMCVSQVNVFRGFLEINSKMERDSWASIERQFILNRSSRGGGFDTPNPIDVLSCCLNDDFWRDKPYTAKNYNYYLATYLRHLRGNVVGAEEGKDKKTRRSLFDTEALLGDL